ncbi:MAG: EH signature domain-containing protein, partial [Planktothrix sp.]
KDRLFWRLAVYYNQANQNQIGKNRPRRRVQESPDPSELESDREKADPSKISDRPVLPLSLVHCFPDFASEFKKTDLLPVDILLALGKNKGNSQIAALSYEYLITPKSLVKQAQLPASIYGMHETFILIAEKLITKKNLSKKQTHLSIYSLDKQRKHLARLLINFLIKQQKEQVSLLINSLDEMAGKPQLHGVEYLLTKGAKQIAGQFPILVNWVQKHYGITSPDTRWSELSQRAKTALQDWIGALSYGYFVKLVQILLDKLDLPGWERNQLERRREFWSNYSDRFERIRILLPQSSQKAIKEAISSEFEHQDISILQEDGSDPTEVCIFDFGHCCIVEFFRGTGSETRIFNAQDYPDIKTKLFQSPTLSLKRLRYLGGEIHDHKYLWQASCEKLLRNRNIYPNEGTQYFKGLHKNYSQYNRETGLPEPSPRKQEDRENELKRWEKDMREIKIEASLFCRQLES